MSDLEFRGSDFGLADWRDNLEKSVDEFIDTVEREIVESKLAKLGYVKVMRCRDCEYYGVVDEIFTDHGDITIRGCERLEFKGDMLHEFEPRNSDGYCYWGKERTKTKHEGVDA